MKDMETLGATLALTGVLTVSGVLIVGAWMLSCWLGAIATGLFLAFVGAVLVEASKR